MKNILPGTLLLSSGGKINLFLEIHGKRKDGYHLLESLFLPIPEPRDYLTINILGHGQGLADFTTNSSDLNQDDNTLTKAYTIYAVKTGFQPRISLYLEKGIPSGAGLGGGSADAALLLGWLQKHNPKPLGKAALKCLGLAIGADVPFFLDPRPSLVRGIGEIIEPVPMETENLWFVLVCPKIFVSSTWAFKQWDQSLTENAPEDKCHSSYFRCPLKVANSLESVVFKAWPKLGLIKKQLLTCGAQAAGMSGSGSSLFGIFSDLDQADQAAKKMHGLEKNQVFGPFLPGTG